jgi:hypothetical protein
MFLLRGQASGVAAGLKLPARREFCQIAFGRISAISPQFEGLASARADVTGRVNGMRQTPYPWWDLL